VANDIARFSAASGSYAILGGSGTLSGVIIDGDASWTLSGFLNGTGDIVKNGAGTLTLSAASNGKFWGRAIVNEGQLTLASGAGAGGVFAGEIIVGPDGTLLLTASAFGHGDGTGNFISHVTLDGSSMTSTVGGPVYLSGTLEMTGATVTDTAGGGGRIELYHNPIIQTHASSVTSVIDMAVYFKKWAANTHPHTLDVERGTAGVDLLFMRPVSQEAFKKDGVGIVKFAADTSFGGGAINGGTVLVDGIHTGGKFTVNSGATIGGVGSLKAVDVNAGATLSAGSIGNATGAHIAGTLTLDGAVSVKTGAKVALHLALDAGGIAASDSLAFAAGGSLAFESGSTLHLLTEGGSSTGIGLDFDSLLGGLGNVSGFDNILVVKEGGGDFLLGGTTLTNRLKIIAGVFGVASNGSYLTALTLEGGLELVSGGTLKVVLGGDGTETRIDLNGVASDLDSVSLEVEGSGTLVLAGVHTANYADVNAWAGVVGIAPAAATWNDGTYVAVVTSVPEPSTYALWGAAGALALALVRRRRRV
jgi:hypothetical protein